VVLKHFAAAPHDVSKPDFSGEEQADRLFIGSIQDRARSSASGCYLKTKL
jgi:hypothetical protein